MTEKTRGFWLIIAKVASWIVVLCPFSLSFGFMVEDAIRFLHGVIYTFLAAVAVMAVGYFLSDL